MLLSGKVRFAMLSVIIVVLLIALAKLTYCRKLLDTTVFSSALVVIATLTPFLYRLFVFVPVLEVRQRRELDIAKPTLRLYTKRDNELIDLGTHGYLRLEVVNYGLVAAKNCIPKVHILKRPYKDGKECEAPSREYNTFISLTWSGEPKEARTIPPSANDFVDIIIMPLTEDGKARLKGQWHDQDEWGPLISWFATLDVVRHGCKLRAQDGLVEGQYIVEIGVFAENSKSVIKRFELVINQEWGKVNLNERRFLGKYSKEQML
jgi:hypothetical protein